MRYDCWSNKTVLVRRWTIKSPDCSTIENHCTWTAQPWHVSFSRRVHKIVYLAVNKGNILFIFFTSENIHRELLSFINPAVYLLNKKVVGWVIVATAPDVCQKCDFFLKRGWTKCLLMFWNVCHTFDKFQNTNPLMCTKFDIWGQSILEGIQAFHTVRIDLYIGCSGPVVECWNRINMNQSTTRPLGQNTQYTELCVQYEKLKQLSKCSSLRFRTISH